MLLQCVFFSQCSLAEIYKYKDAKGKWQYTDKKPQNAEVEKLHYKSDDKPMLLPKFSFEQREGKGYLSVKNIFYAPIELELKSPQLESGRKVWVIPAQSQKVLIQRKGAIEPWEFRWHLGDPTAVPKSQLYQFPFNSLSCMRISQGFNGRFSHSADHSRYAVDISMNVGTSIVAARAGIVVEVKDDYYMGGVNEYFLDKGNFISVMHEDGSFARYVHILLSSAKVKPGDKVQVGQELAESGSSGFSSGPHLHLVVTRNAGFSNISIPFHFVTRNGEAVLPKEGLKICDQLIQN